MLQTGAMEQKQHCLILEFKNAAAPPQGCARREVLLRLCRRAVRPSAWNRFPTYRSEHPRDDKIQPHTAHRLAAQIELMVRIIRSDDAKNFACPHCGTIYEINWSSPAHDSGSIECEICYELMVRWKDCAIPSLRVKNVQSMIDPMLRGRILRNSSINN